MRASGGAVSMAGHSNAQVREEIGGDTAAIGSDEGEVAVETATDDT